MDIYEELTPVRYSTYGVNILRGFAFRERENCFTVHWHERIELLLVREGSLELYLGERHAATVHAGSVAIVGPRQPHSAVAGGRGVVYDVLSFRADHFLNGTSATGQLLRPLLEGRVELLPASQELWKGVSAVLEASKCGPLEAVGRVYQLLNILLDACVVAVRPGGAADRRFRQVVEYVSSHYTEPLTTAGLSDRFGYDEAYFCRRFKKETGLNVLRYVEILRLELAKRLLREMDWKISQVAARCGYGDVCYFSHRFHSHVGQSPSAFRREARSAEKR